MVMKMERWMAQTQKISTNKTKKGKRCQNKMFSQKKIQ